MLFSSMIYLWIFLPVVLGSYFIIKDEFKNILLLIASLIFYAWGEPKYIILMLCTITINYVAGLLMENKNKRGKEIILLGTIIIDLGFLFYFKYYNLFVDTVNSLTASQTIEPQNIALPIGISFYTFQAMSYVIDLYREEINVQKSWLKMSLYISFFPQLIAGPIVKYKDICKQIDQRKCSVEKFSYGVKRFSYGLGKKVIISNSLAAVVDNILNLDISFIGTNLSWCVAICYTMQIYFDFSGYSDMAIGLGKMFGFDILENFNYPYISKSIQEFWRRWHISLSTWFKEYLYIPLGGNRKGTIRTYINLFIVFLVTGLWHGASYTFVIWGLFHGFFSIIERLFLGKYLKKNPVKPLNYLYTMIVVMVGWVLFRCDTLGQALCLIKNMFIYKESIGYNLAYFLSTQNIIILFIAIVVSIIIPALSKRNTFVEERTNTSWIEIGICSLILLYSIFLLICDTYNPFIYFRF